MLAKCLAVLLELNLAFYLLLILACPIDLAGLFVFDLNEFVLLCHINELRSGDYSTGHNCRQGHAIGRSFSPEIRAFPLYMPSKVVGPEMRQILGTMSGRT